MGSTCLTLINCLSLTKLYFLKLDLTKFLLVCREFSSLIRKDTEYMLKFMLFLH